MNAAHTSPIPRIVALDQLSDEPIGGKAAGLARLIQLGLRVPPGFVILDAAPGSLPDSLESAYRALGEVPVSVRSSALGEDSERISYAGQYTTLLDVQGLDALSAAVEQCLHSANGLRAQAYRQNMGHALDVRMAVVVQQMVSPRSAGVLFTVDPTGQQQEHLIVEAVEGLGESLVSGQATPDRYFLSRSGELVRQDLRGPAALLEEAELRRLASEALHAERGLGYALDMEWAIDHDGGLHWLQARPITAAPQADLFELDSEVHSPEDLFTSCNIGEILPGAITPLTWSVFGLGQEAAFHDMFSYAGANVPAYEGIPFIYLFGGHLYLSLSRMYIICAEAVGTSKHDLDLSLTGRVLSAGEVPPPAPTLRRMKNGAKYIRYLFSARKRVAGLAERVAAFHVPPASTASEQLARIEENLPRVADAWATHLSSSSGSGMFLGVLTRILSGGAPARTEDHAEAAALLVHIERVESAEVIEDLDRVVAHLAADEAGARAFEALSPEAALDWLRGPDSGETGTLFRDFMSKHGHRGFREVELRQKGWGDDPLPFVSHLQTLAATYGSRPTRATREQTAAEAEGVLSQLSWTTRKLVGQILAGAKTAIRERERSKSLCVKVMSEYKHAFRHLGELLVDAGRLPDVDAIFFLTLDEVKQVISEPHPELVSLARQRRRILPEQMALLLPDVSVGRPEPLESAPEVVELEGGLTGVPVSRGTAIGPARVALRVEDAAELQPGEILIVYSSDVGWTPYYTLAGGLAADIGSPLSHGAVIAREYGLPAVVDLRAATRAFQTGEMVMLNADNGTLRRVRPGNHVSPGGEPRP